MLGFCSINVSSHLTADDILNKRLHTTSKLFKSPGVITNIYVPQTQIQDYLAFRIRYKIFPIKSLEI